MNHNKPSIIKTLLIKSVKMQSKLGMPDGNVNGSNVFLLKDEHGNPIKFKGTEFMESFYMIGSNFSPNIKATLSFYNTALEPQVVLESNINISELYTLQRGEYAGPLSEVYLGITFDPKVDSSAYISAIGSVQKITIKN